MGIKETILICILIPVYIAYSIGVFLALPYRLNRKFRRKAIRKKCVTAGWLVKQSETEITYNYRIGKALHSVEIDFNLDLNSKPEEIPEKVTVYYLEPRASEILIEELSTFDKKDDLIAFLIHISIPVIIYLVLDWWIF